eukprot:m51a1_g2959 hypothetical protein (775) ;mRNA; r:662894-669177
MADESESTAFKQAWRVLEDAEEKVLEQAEALWEERVEEQMPEDQAKRLSRHRPHLPEVLAKSPRDAAEGAAADSAAALYTGPRIGSTFTQESAVELVKSFMGSVKLHAAYVQRVLQAAKHHLKRQCGTVSSVRVPPGGRVIVVGDTHGQLTDVSTIFDKYGYPAKNNVYVFNGDYVDRGPQGLEILLVLYTLLMADPATIFLNRGNHEQRHINERYDFRAQVLQSYSELEFEMAMATFKYLPLATVINDVVFVVHGGVSPHTEFTVEALREMRRIDPHNSKDRHAELVKNLLWSDPRDEDGWCMSDRGSGVEWGPDITHAFLGRNNLALIIRSHEVKDEGFEFQHDGRCLTVFSASNYCGLSENKAAVAIIEGPAWDSLDTARKAIPKIESFYALAFGNSAQLCKTQTLQMLRKHIFMSRHQLVESFTNADTNHTGLVSVDTFVQVLADVVEMNLNWRVLWPYFAKTDANGMINYTNVLNRYRVAVEGSFCAEFMKSAVLKICKKIADANNTLYTAWREMDTNGDGELSYTEFVNAMQKFDIGLTVEQIYDLFHSIDTNNSGSIDFNEFNTAFKKKLERARSTVETDKDREWARRQLVAILQMIQDCGEEIEVVFECMDSNGSGQLNPTEFNTGLKNLGLTYTVDESKAIMKHMNAISAASGVTIKCEAFKMALGRAKMELLEAEQGDAFMFSTIHCIARGLQKHSIQLGRLFRQMDVDGTGNLTFEEFRVGLRALNNLLDIPLSDDQLEALHQLLDKDHDGPLLSTAGMKALW